MSEKHVLCVKWKINFTPRFYSGITVAEFSELNFFLCFCSICACVYSNFTLLPTMNISRRSIIIINKSSSPTWISHKNYIRFLYFWFCFAVAYKYRYFIYLSGWKKNPLPFSLSQSIFGSTVYRRNFARAINSVQS